MGGCCIGCDGRVPFRRPDRHGGGDGGAADRQRGMVCFGVGERGEEMAHALHRREAAQVPRQRREEAEGAHARFAEGRRAGRSPDHRCATASSWHPSGERLEIEAAQDQPARLAVHVAQDRLGGHHVIEPEFHADLPHSQTSIEPRLAWGQS